MNMEVKLSDSRTKTTRFKYTGLTNWPLIIIIIIQYNNNINNIIIIIHNNISS